MKKRSVAIILVIILAIVCYTQFTIFVIPPIGAIPEGKTLIILRGNQTVFLDSPDAMCERIQGGVSLLCRGLTLGAVGKGATIILRLPYSEQLHSMSIPEKID